MSRATAAGAYVLYALHAWATLSAAFRDERSPTDSSFGLAVGGAMALFSLSLYAAGAKTFGSIGQLSGLEEGELITDGVYRYTRNPQIARWGIALAGAALVGRSAKALALVSACFLAHRLYSPFEERYLEHRFGEEYRRYRRNVPRFLEMPG